MKIIVIGAGPSGLMCASKLGQKGCEVIVLEKNEKAGKKIYISGKGRCNVTNNCTEKEFISNVIRNPYFLYNAYKNFTSQNTIEYFESRGVKLVTERGNRVFPESYKAYEITDALVKDCRDHGVRLHFNERVLNIEKKNDYFEIFTLKNTYTADKVVIATGGKSYPLTGSTGDGYKFANDFKHEVIPLVPGLVALKIKENIPSNLLRFTAKNVSLNLKIGKKNISEFGDLTFYNEGVAGPIALTISSMINRIDPKHVSIEIDWKPSLTDDQLENRILREIQAKPKENSYELIRKMIPGELMDFFVHKCNCDLTVLNCELPKATRNQIITNLKHFKLTYLGLDDIERAIVTSGGINTNEINQKTMESKLVNGLYFVGEVLDVDAFTGVFNMQIAFSTGALAGDSIE